jgi:alpha-beta hydrolase superfamily lysophospholipase
LVSPTVFLGLYLMAAWLILAALITPERERAGHTPAALGFYDIRQLTFESMVDRVPLRGWLVPAKGDRVIVLVHGIHSHAWDCQTPDVVRAYVGAGFSVFLFDLRAHGDSGGPHAGLGLLERGDVRGAVELLRQRGFQAGKIGIHGTSYGAATALLATEQIPEIGAVVADSAFANIREMIGGELHRKTGLPASLSSFLMPGIDWLASRLYSMEMDAAAPERAIRRISPRPILLIHGIQDPVIPFDHARRLKTAAGAAAELWPLPGGHTEGVRMGHRCRESASTRDAFLAKVGDFFDKNLGTQVLGNAIMHELPSEQPSLVD